MDLTHCRVYPRRAASTWWNSSIMCDLISRCTLVLFFVFFPEILNQKERRRVTVVWFSSGDTLQKTTTTNPSVLTQLSLHIELLFSWYVCLWVRKSNLCGDNFTSKQLFILFFSQLWCWVFGPFVFCFSFTLELFSTFSQHLNKQYLGLLHRWKIKLTNYLLVFDTSKLITSRL